MQITVLDKGPHLPPLAADADDAAKAAHSAAEHEHAEWHERNKEPVKVTMAAVDAHHAVAADPERYEIVERQNMVRPAGDLESRLSNIEARLERLENPEEEPSVSEPVE
jgi:hypothetical protein